MQPISGVPMYPSCFDQLTTNGVIAEDLVGYVTGTPSPYLQNYVAQRGGTPSLPGRTLPDTLTPAVPPKQPLPQGDIYNVAPKDIGPETLEPPKKHKINNIKEIATGLLLAGLTVFAFIKGKSALSAIKNTFTKIFKHTPTPPSGSSWFNNLGQKIMNGGKKIVQTVSKYGKLATQTIVKYAKKAANLAVTGFNKVCNFVKGLFHKIPKP